MKATLALLFAGAALAGACAAVPPAPAGLPAPEFERVLAAEDARAGTPAHEETLRAALRSTHAGIRALAVRALGRTERRQYFGDIAAALADGDAAVRAEAAHALGNVTRDSASADARDVLLRALPEPGTDPLLAGAAAETLGRLRHDAAGARAAAAAMAPMLALTDASRRGALRGFYFLARQPTGRAAVAEHGAALWTLAEDADSPRDRALAVATLTAAGAAVAELARSAYRDRDWTVRREAVLAAGAIADTAATMPILEAALRDAAPQVRYEALRAHARRSVATACARAAAAARDDDAHVAILAAGVLAGAECGGAAYTALLDSLARAPAEWQRAAAAVSALAALRAPGAAAHVQTLASHASPFARAHAAHAAGALGDAPLLRRLVADDDANVRTAAVSALQAVEGRAADDIFIAALSGSESELLQAAARALEGSPDPRAVPALLDALDRVSEQRSQTSRDARAALLVRLRELGSAAHAGRVQRYLQDFDPAIAQGAADVLAAWTGTRPAVQPQQLPHAPLPGHRDLERLATSRFVLELADGAAIEIALLPFVAPTNAWRFARLARAGYYDGLTIHRVVPNFVVQGGSPGANEYSGHPLFSRDELGAPNWRGSVGLSTRGRDTGDAQFYINLIDNVRLDHEYTIFGTVTRGMEHVDALLEGAVIRRVREVR